MTIHVTIWNEFVHERENAEVAKIYPQGMHQTIAEGLNDNLSDVLEVTTATLDQPDQGLPEKLLDDTDVLFWWGHLAHDRVEDALVDRIQQRVLAGMGLVVLHSGHDSKPFKRLMGTNCQLRWREEGERERLWVVDPGHPLVDGLGAEYFELDQAEMYGEQFGIPTPDELVMISWFEGGEVFRSLCTWRRGKGKNRLLSSRSRVIPDLPKRQRPTDPSQRRHLGGPERSAVCIGLQESTEVLRPGKLYLLYRFCQPDRRRLNSTASLSMNAVVSRTFRYEVEAYLAHACSRTDLESTLFSWWRTRCIAVSWTPNGSKRTY